MSLLGYADLDRPLDFDQGRIHHPFGGGAFRLEPFGCGVGTTRDGTVDFHLELTRGLTDRDTRAVLELGLVPQYALQEALARVRAIDVAATLMPVVLTDWTFAISPTPGLRIPTELGEPVTLASNGLGSMRLSAELSVDSGQILEAMLRERTPLAGVATARMEGVSPRVPVVVRFDAAALLRPVMALADAQGRVAWDALAAFFAHDPASLPLQLDGTLADDARTAFGQTMADHVVARFGAYAAPRTGDTSLVAVLQVPPGSTTISWALVQAVPACRLVTLRVDVLGAAQAQADRLGIDSLVHRGSFSELPPLGRTRITALCCLPPTRSGVEALGVNVAFAPRLPERPQPRAATLLLEPPSDMAVADVQLAPGEPCRYTYSTFAVFSDEEGTRQVDAPAVAGSSSTLHLSAGDFPVDFVLVEASAALAALAVVTGTVSYTAAGRAHARAFTLDSGRISVAIAVPKDRTDLRTDAVACARDGSGRIALGPFEDLHVALDVTSFPAYGPRQADLRCVFDDSASVRAVSVLPAGRADTPENVTTLSFSPADPLRTFHWFATSPFHAGYRYRAYDPQGGAWTDVAGDGALVLFSSQLKRRDGPKEVAVRTATAMRESAPRRLASHLESDPAPRESAVDPVGTSPQPTPTDELVYTRVSDASQKLYVPRFTLDLQVVSGQQRYRVAMVQGQAASTLEVDLLATMAPAVSQAAHDAAEYPLQSVKVCLEYLIAPPAGAVKSLEFTDVTRNGANVRAVLTFASLQERDEVYHAITEPERHARLVVQRFIDVNVPQAPPPQGSMTFVLPVRPLAALTTATFVKPLPPVAAPIAASTMKVPAATLALMVPKKETGVVVRREAAPVALASSALLANATFTTTAAAPLAAVVARVPAGTTFTRWLPVPELAFLGATQDATGIRVRLAIANSQAFDDFFAPPDDDLPPGPGGHPRRLAVARISVNVKDAATKATLYNFSAVGSADRLADFSFSIAAGTALPRQLMVTMTDLGGHATRDSNAVATVAPVPPKPPIVATRSQLDQSVTPEPFTFSPALHGYIFQGLTPAGGASGLIRYRLQWHGSFYTYLQDASRPAVVYCFPDKFKIARRREAPYTPFITVRVNSHEDGSDATVVLDYVVAPYTDPKRLEDARTQLLADAHFGSAAPQFQPFASSDVRYFVDRPTRGGSVREQRADAALVLQGALKDTLSMPLGDFQVLFDAMQRETASMFMGHVEIDVPHADTEVIPFEARLDDLEGEMFTYQASLAQDGSCQVQLRNAIESPVDVHTLDVTLTRGGQAVHGNIRAGAVPHTGLQPGETLALTVVPATALPGSGAPEVAFGLGGVSVIPDAAAVWNKIFDSTTSACYRMVTVRALASLFQAVAGHEDQQIAAILVAFEGGGTAELNATTLSAQVRIDYAIDDVVLGRPVSNNYRYTVTVVRNNGDQNVDPQPREATAQTFYVSVVR